MSKAALIRDLRKILPADGLLTDPHDCEAYSTDWTKHPGKAGAVVLPRNVQEVAAILKACSKHKHPIVPSGGRTGLAGGAVPLKGEIVLSMGRIKAMQPVSHLSRTVRVGAGAITQDVHNHCEEEGLTWPIDLASKGSCQIGGNLSTNAGGLKVIRYGMTRKWVTGLQVVTIDGRVLELNSGLEKNNTGYDLLQLIVGSEGTLAVITEATLKLTRVPAAKGKSVFFFSLRDLRSLPILFEKFRRGPFELHAFEFFSDKCLAAVGECLGRKSRLQKAGSYYVIAEVVGEEAREGWLEEVMQLKGVEDASVADSPEDQRAIWGLREGITESLARSAAIRKHDLSVPIADVAPFLEEVENAVKSFQIGLYLFGHFGDGSPHVNLVCPNGLSAKVFEKECSKFEPKLFSILQKFHGSISSEHGVGVLKKEWLSYSRGKEELKVFKKIKSSMDPRGLLNPGKIW